LGKIFDFAEIAGLGILVGTGAAVAGCKNCKMDYWLGVMGLELIFLWG
jgi:hypothetical protein